MSGRLDRPEPNWSYRVFMQRWVHLAVISVAGMVLSACAEDSRADVITDACAAYYPETASPGAIAVSTDGDLLRAGLPNVRTAVDLADEAAARHARWREFHEALITVMQLGQRQLAAIESGSYPKPMGTHEQAALGIIGSTCDWGE